MLTFPVMLTSQCCYNPLRANLRNSNMSLMVPRRRWSLLMFGKRKVLPVLYFMFTPSSFLHYFPLLMSSYYSAFIFYFFYCLMCAQFYKILTGERNRCLTFLIRPTGAVWVHPNATWHFWTVLIFQYYDQRLVMQPAWIISVHSVQAWLFETSPVLGLQGAGGSKNTISQVVSHELKIAEHSFPVRLLHCPPNPPAFLLRSNLSPPPAPTLPPYTAHTVVFRDRRPPSPQPDEEICRNEKRKKEKERGGGKKESTNWSGHRYMTHIPSPSPHPSPRHAAAVIWGCFHNVLPSNFFGVYFGDVWIRWQTGRKCGTDTSAELR